MITRDKVLKLAQLSKLQLTEEQLPTLTQNLTDIHNMLNQIDAVDCSDIEPLTSVCGTGLRMREDIVTVDDISKDVLSNAPSSAGYSAIDIQCFIVPKVVE